MLEGSNLRQVIGSRYLYVVTRSSSLESPEKAGRGHRADLVGGSRQGV